MSRFNQYMNSHFAGCRLLAEGRDQVRDRDVKMYLVPGYPDDVGVTDGTDSWVMPLAADGFGALGSVLKGISVRDIVRRVFDGEDVPVARLAFRAKGRVRLAEEPAPEDPPTAGRRRQRVLFDEPAPVSPTTTTAEKGKRSRNVLPSDF